MLSVFLLGVVMLGSGLWLEEGNAAFVGLGLEVSGMAVLAKILEEFLGKYIELDVCRLEKVTIDDNNNWITCVVFMPYLVILFIFFILSMFLPLSWWLVAVILIMIALLINLALFKKLFVAMPVRHIAILGGVFVLSCAFFLKKECGAECAGAKITERIGEIIIFVGALSSYTYHQTIRKKKAPTG